MKRLALSVLKKNNFYYCNHYNAYFNVSITSRDTKSSRNLYVSSRLGECLDRELQRLVPIPASWQPAVASRNPQTRGRKERVLIPQYEKT